MPGTDLYLVMVDDRHRDSEAHPFSSPEMAVAYARQLAEGWLVEQTSGRPDGWLYQAVHPTETDCVWVIARTLDRPPLF